MRHAVPTLALGAAFTWTAVSGAAEQAPPPEQSPPSSTQVAAQAAPSAAPAIPSLSGHWKLNVQDSEDARQKVKKSMDGGGGASGGSPGGGAGRGGGGYGHGGGGGYGRGGGGGYGHGGGGGYGGGGHRSGGGDSAPAAPNRDPQGARAALFNAPQELTVTQTATEIAILDQDGLMRALHPDGQSYKAGSGEDEVKTRWEADHLVVETKTKGGTKLTETYGLDAEKHRLTVVLNVEGGSRPAVSVRRFYDQPTTDAQR